MTLLSPFIPVAEKFQPLIEDGGSRIEDGRKMENRGSKIEDGEKSRIED
jgi:hypothetical protein